MAYSGNASVPEIFRAR